MKTLSSYYKYASVNDYLEFTVIFSLFYIFDKNFADLMFFFFFIRQNVHTRKIGHASEVLHDRARPTGIGHAI